MKNFAITMIGKTGLPLLLSLWIITHIGCNTNNKQVPTQTKENKPVDTKDSLPVMADAATILNRPEVPILCYHRLRDFRSTDSKRARDYIVPGAMFVDQIKLLADSGYHTILPGELYQWLAYGKPLPSKPIMITFDDTHVDQYKIGLPELNKYGFKGVFFIMTVSLGRPGYMNREQVKQLADEGHVISSHTWDHKNVKIYTEEDWPVQVEKPVKQIEAITGKPVQYFAYPFGLWNKEAIVKIKQYGFKAAFQLSAQRDENDPLFTIRRIIVPGEWSAATMLKYLKHSFK
ncbi:MAG TPA: polysaccharide deacetylase family protein [Chitinophagaceae bacterium]|nr:polysaccharide deacetylase family protein [Chitinophagaceae bacterium]